MKKSMLFLVTLILIFLMLTVASADTPTSPRSHLTPVPDFSSPVFILQASVSASIAGPTSTTTGTECAYTVNNGSDEGVTYYRFAVAILDDTHSSGAADTMYDEYNVAPHMEGTFSYTFYTAGTYGIWCYRYDDDMSLIPWTYRGTEYGFIYKQVRVSESDSSTALDQKVEEIAESCKSDDDYETVLAINDYLTSHVAYDYNQQYYSPEAALLNGSSVCNGYSRAFNLIADVCGLRSRRAVGGEHAWNAVQMDEEWYYVDPTWNCTTGSHRYLGITGDILDFDHTLENTVGGSVNCHELADNYYVRSGTWELLATEIQPVMEEMVGNRLHIFHLSMGDEAYTEYEGIIERSSAQRNVNGHVIAYVYSGESWIVEATGETFSTTFRYDYDTNTVNGVFKSTGTIIFPNDLEELEYQALMGVAAYYVIIPDKCTTIGAEVFSDSKVWEVTVPDSVTKINDDAFTGTLGLTIRTNSGSTAAIFAEKNGIPVVIE